MTAIDTLRDRRPGQSVVEELLRRQGDAQPRSRLARVLGISPLTGEAKSWYTGARGEFVVGALLQNLPDEWTVLHSVPVGRGETDIDHLVVGPGGVLTINTKHHPGQRVWVGRRTFMVAGQRQPYLRNSESEARRVARILQLINVGCRVIPVIAVVGAQSVTVRTAPDEVKVIEAGRLVRWVRKRPRVLTPEAVVQLAAVLERSSTWRPTTVGEDVWPRFEALDQEVRGARQTRAIWTLGALAAGAAIALPPIVTALFG